MEKAHAVILLEEYDKMREAVASAKQLEAQLNKALAEKEAAAKGVLMLYNNMFNSIPVRPDDLLEKVGLEVIRQPGYKNDIETKLKFHVAGV